ncbi:hypothetical protein ZOSMA_185G00340 [Zostera marina]|uniref:Viral late gene transcription factor 3 zinc ribbon domain-containing protein n=1 Tax=Zostera marina TaxID=29655 RepID=A0A0K9PSL4_ZOSMR|nr:hypothetical protein ZOSMA_185G00340 [Zostera marina]
MQQTMALMVMELYSTNLVAPFLSQKSSLSSILKPKTVNLHGRRRSIVRAIDGAAADFVPPEITWQITVGAIAGTTPFVVAGIEFGKRIVAQKKCEICNGSGLVQTEDDNYTRCPNCGGFLPWLSWKRFFTG